MGFPKSKLAIVTVIAELGRFKQVVTIAVTTSVVAE